MQVGAAVGCICSFVSSGRVLFRTADRVLPCPGKGGRKVQGRKDSLESQNDQSLVAHSNFDVYLTELNKSCL